MVRLPFLYDIALDIMDSKKANKLRQEIERLRRSGGVRSRDLIGIAEGVGRTRFPRGKEPTWVMSGRFPLSIPVHPGTMKRGTVHSILKLASDIDALEAVHESDE